MRSRHTWISLEVSLQKIENDETILKKWLDETPRRRSYVFLNVKELTDACIKKFGGAKSTWQSEGKEKLIEN